MNDVLVYPSDRRIELALAYFAGAASLQQKGSKEAAFAYMGLSIYRDHKPDDAESQALVISTVNEAEKWLMEWDIAAREAIKDKRHRK